MKKHTIDALRKIANDEYIKQLPTRSRYGMGTVGNIDIDMSGKSGKLNELSNVSDDELRHFRNSQADMNAYEVFDESANPKYRKELGKHLPLYGQIKQHNLKNPQNKKPMPKFKYYDELPRTMQSMVDEAQNVQASTKPNNWGSTV